MTLKLASLSPVSVVQPPPKGETQVGNPIISPRKGTLNTYFRLRGLEKVNGEWLLICTGHNLLKLFRFGVNLHRKARVDGPAQRIRNFAEVVEHGAIPKAIWGPTGATGKISCRDPLSLTRKHR